MRLPKTLILLVLTLLTLPATAAEDTTFYDLRWQPATRSAAAYFRPRPEFRDGLYHFRDYYRSGVLQCEGQFSDPEPEVREGRFRYYSQAGTLTGEEHYRAGKLVDTATYHHLNRVVKTCRYPDTGGAGYCRIYDSTTGIIRREGLEKDGILEGPRRFYTSGGRLFRIIEMEKGLLHGCGEEFDTLSGIRRADAVYLQNKMVSTRLYTPGGKTIGELCYVDERKNGLSRRWDTLTGMLITTRTFLNDSLTGPAENYGHDCPFLRESYQLLNGTRNGACRTYYQCSDKLFSLTQYENGELNGPYLSYDLETGRRVVEGKDVQGKEEGEWHYYFPDGKSRRMLKTYRNGMLHGSLRTWWPSGKLRREEKYVEGKLDSRRCFARNGSDTVSYPATAHASFLKPPQYYFDRWLHPAPGTSGKARLMVTVQPDKTISHVKLIASDVPELNSEILRIAYKLPVVQAGGEDDMVYYTNETFTINIQPQSEAEED